jgi:sensor histidine kinase YesM
MGRISLRASCEDGFAVISISDNGKGMRAEKVREIMNGAKAEEPKQGNRHGGHTNGIGLNNVQSRLKIFYSREDILKIYSEPGQGTEVVLRIPMDAGQGK